MIARRLLLLAAVAVLAVAGVALAAKGGGGKVTLCAQGEAGALSLAKGGKCPDGARKLSLAKQGPRGKAGVPGPAGAPGPAGPDASPAALAPEPVRLVAARGLVGTCSATPGVFCSYYVPAQGYDNVGGGFAKVGYFKDSSGIVHLQGMIELVCPGGCQGTAYAYTTVFFLPPAYRPLDGTREFTVGVCNEEGGLRSVRIRTDGGVELSSICAIESLDGISFQP